MSVISKAMKNKMGSRIRYWRKAIPIKSFQLAEKLKISQGSLSDIENNKSKPSADTIVAFIERTDIDIFWMLTGNRDQERGKEIVYAEPILTINVSPGQEILIKGQ